MATNKLFLHDHPVSSYAQKVRIALREKGIDFDSKTPEGLGASQNIPALKEANPRVEVPALVDGDVKIFDSTIILQYLEDKYPDSPLLPKDPASRAQVRMLEEVCDTHYEALNWGYGEIKGFGRATGDLAEQLIDQVKKQTATLQAYLTEQLGTKPYFNGDSFGYGDLCVAPVYNRSVHYGFGAPERSALADWHKRIQQHASVRTTFAEMAAGLGKMMSIKDAFKGTGARREYRDHRLEWLVKSGGMQIVLDGMKEGNIRFSWPDAV